MQQATVVTGQGARAEAVLGALQVPMQLQQAAVLARG